MKRVLSGIMAVCLLLTLTACQKTEENVTAKEMEDLEALTFEEIAAGNTASADVREGTVYQYVTDTVTIDTHNLIQVNETETEAIASVVELLNAGLYTGNTTYVDDSILNYMLWEFAATPYTWCFKDYEIKGIDAATRLYFVDVTYETTKNEKTLIPDSLIVRGDPDEDKLKEKRYSDYVVWLRSQGDTQGAETDWQYMIRNEWETADALSVFAHGLSYDSVMNGYTVDYQTETALNKDEIENQYGTDVYVDATGRVVDADTYTFEDRWGSLEDIFATQNGMTMVDRLRTYGNTVVKDELEVETLESDSTEETVDEDVTIEGAVTDVETTAQHDLGVYTYAGLTEVAQDYGATMTFRVVFKYVYSIGTENTMEIQSLYLYDYKLQNSDDLVAAYTTETVQNGNVLQPFIQRTLKAYRKALEESNHQGLYDLFVTYDKYDTYVSDLVSYCYVSNGGITTEVVGRKGDEVAVLVTQRTKKRAKGTSMSMPTYQETVLVKVKLCSDDKVRIVSLTTLQSILIGEPLSIIRNVTGVSEQIAFDSTAFSNANAVAVENAVAEFINIELQYNGTELRPGDYDVVDLGIAATEKKNMLQCFDVVKQLGAKKAGVWLTGYSMKSNVYCTVNIREVFVGTDKNLDTEATIGVLNRNGQWKVISYNRTLCVPTEAQDITGITDTALALIDATAETPIQYIVRTEATDTDTSVDLNTTAEDWEVERVTEPAVADEAVVGVDESGNAVETTTTKEIEESSTQRGLGDFF